MLFFSSCSRQYSPFRAGYEWWLPLDMVRILILTSWMGFVSKACYMKVLMSQMISLVFLVLFLYWRPCTSFVCASNMFIFRDDVSLSIGRCIC